MDSDSEEHTHRVAGEMIEWVAGVVWSVWDWRARWASHRGAAYYAALDQEKKQTETDYERASRIPVRTPTPPVPRMPEKVPCPCCTGALISCRYIEQEALNICQVCPHSWANQAYQMTVCNTTGCRGCRICYECMERSGVLKHMVAADPEAPLRFRNYVARN
jgi:hypothetical protein